MEPQFDRTPRFKSPEEEIAFLREQVSEKERELGASIDKSPREEIITREIRDYKEQPTENVLTDDYRMRVDEIEEKVLNLTPEHDAKVDELVAIMEEKGIKNALSVAEKLNNPHIEDDLHRLLVQYLMEFEQVPGLKESTPLFKALRMKLFEVTLPKLSQSGEERRFSELVSGMEQFYAGMLSVAEPNGGASVGKRYFTIELALSNYEEEIVFYCAVPRVRERLFEKQLLGIFPDARIREHKEDYNPFNEGGATLASYAVPSDNPLLPVKTYEGFENDPLNIILGAFSKIEKEGEGAAIQLVLSPAGDTYNKRYGMALDKVREGASLKEATEHVTATVAKEFGGAMKKLVFGHKSPEPRGEDSLVSAKISEETMQDMADKISAHILDTNIRIVASAGDRARAETILGELESAFNQFGRPSANSIVFKRLTNKKLANLIHEFTFRIYSKDESFPLNTKELTAIMHFPVTTVSATELREERAKRAPAPSGVSSEGVLLGINKYRTEEIEVRFKREDRLRHFYVIGQTGTGKTTLLKNMIVQDIANGDGVCMIDPHGSDIQDILANIPKERIDDVIYFDPAHTARPMGLNMLEYDINYPEQKTFVVNELFSIFQKLYAGSPEAMGPMFEQYFRNSAMLVVEDPATGNTLLDVSRVMTDERFREIKLSRSKNPVINQFWREVAGKAGGEAALANIVPYITSKFDVFLANEIMRPIIAQEKSAFDFRKIMDEKKILLVNLSKGRLGDINSSLIGLILVGKILQAALSRVDAKERPDFYLYIDEFQNVTTNSISTILSEARKYRLSLNIAHQYIAQLEDGIRDSVFGNVGSIAAYRVG